MAEFTKAAETRDVPAGRMKLVRVNDTDIVIANVGGTFYAFSDTCTHDHGPLSDGDLDGTVVTCPWHFSQFDVTNGSVVEPPAEDPIQTFPVRVEGESIFVGRAAG